MQVNKCTSATGVTSNISPCLSNLYFSLQCTTQDGPFRDAIRAFTTYRGSQGVVTLPEIFGKQMTRSANNERGWWLRKGRFLALGQVGGIKNLQPHLIWCQGIIKIWYLIIHQKISQNMSENLIIFDNPSEVDLLFS